MNNKSCSVLICLVLFKAILCEMTSGLKIVDVQDNRQTPHLKRHDDVLFRCRNPDNASIDSVTIHGNGLEHTDKSVAEIRVKLGSEHIFDTVFCFYHFKNGTVSPHHIQHYPIILPPTFPTHNAQTTFEVIVGRKGEVVVTFISNPPIHHSHIRIRTPSGHNFTLYRLGHKRGGIHQIHMRFIDVFAADLGGYEITLSSPYGVAKKQIFLVDNTTPAALHYRNKIIGVISGTILAILVCVAIGFCVRRYRYSDKEISATLLSEEAYMGGSASRDDVFLSVHEDQEAQQGPSGSSRATLTMSKEKEIVFVQHHDYSEIRDKEMQEIRSPVT